MTADAILRIIFRAKDESSSVIANVQKKISSAGAAMSKAGAALSVGVTAPLALIGNKMISNASDLNETISKTQAIFKTHSAEMISWSSNSVRTLGLSKRAALDYATSFAGALKNVGGLTETESAAMSQKLTALSSDLSSFFNIGQEDVAGALRSALTGEFEPMKRFNVVLNESIIKEKALAMGLVKGKEPLSAQAKQAATLAIIMQQTSDAQGDFARTSNGLANSSRILNAQYENMTAELGMKLLPYKLKLVEILSKVFEWVTNLSPAWQGALVAVGAFAAALGPVLLVAGSLLSGLGGLASMGVTLSGVMAFLGTAFLPVTAALAAVAAAGYLVYSNWDTLKAAAISVVDSIVQAFTNWRDRNAETINAIIAALSSIWGSIQTIFGVIEGIVAAKVASITAYLSQFLPSLQQGQTAWEVFSTAVKIVVDQMTQNVGAAFKAVAQAFKFVENIMTDQRSIWQQFKDGVSAAAQAVLAAITSMVTEIVAKVKNMGGQLVQAGKDAMAGLVQGISSKISEVKNAAGAIMGHAITAVQKKAKIESPSRVMRAIGKYFSEGLGLGISDGESLVDKASKNLAQAGIDGVKNNLKGAPKINAASGDVAGAAPIGTQDPLDQASSQLAGNMSIVGQMAAFTQDAFNGISNSITGLLNGTMTWGQALMNIGSSIMQSIVKSISDATAAWITQNVIVSGLMKARAALGFALRSKDTAMSVSAAATKTAAEAPSATLASISSFGAAAVVGIAAVLGAMALANSFYTGGYTGKGSRSKVAGVVEHEEFVVNALGTQRNRDFLDFANRGGNLGQLLGTAATAGYNAGASSGVQVVNPTGKNQSPTVILVDSRAAAERASGGVDGPVTIQQVREEIGRARS